MARKSTGGVVEKQTRRGVSFGIRFRANARRQFVHVGYAANGVTRADAERELAYVLEQARRGEWSPAADPVAVPETPTFNEAATAWFEAKCTEGGRHGKGLSRSAGG